MGYCMYQLESDFFIAGGKRAAAVKAIKEIPDNDSDYMGGRYSWVDDNWRRNDNLPDMLRAWRWEVDTDDNRDVVGIHFNGEKLGGDEMVMLNAIAPFVKAGSFIEMQGEDGERWRWVFNGESCEEKQAVISWED